MSTKKESYTPEFQLYKARFYNGQSPVTFRVSKIGPPGAYGYMAEPLGKDGVTLSETHKARIAGYGEHPELAVLMVFNLGAIAEVVPVDEPFREELMALWRKVNG